MRDHRFPFRESLLSTGIGIELHNDVNVSAYEMFSLSEIDTQLFVGLAPFPRRNARLAVKRTT